MKVLAISPMKVLACALHDVEEGQPELCVGHDRGSARAVWDVS